MKSVTTASLCLVVLATVVPCRGQPAVIPNAGFETDADQDGRPDQWVARSYTLKAHRLTTDAPRTGQRAATVELADTNTGYYYSEPQSVPLCEDVEVSVWARVKGEGKAYLILFWMSDPTTYCGRAESATVSDTQGEWTPLRVRGQPPADATLWRMACQFDGPGRVDFDDAEVRITPLSLTISLPDLPPPGQPTEVGEGLYGVVGEAAEVQPGGKLALIGELRATTCRSRLISPAVLWFDGENRRTGGFCAGAENVSTDRPTVQAAVTVPQEAVRGVPILFSRSREDWRRLRCERLRLSPLPEPTGRSPMSKLSTLPHPRLFCTAADLARLRRALAERSDETLCRAWDQYRAEAAQFLGEKEMMFSKFKISLPPVQPPRHEDNFPYWTGGSRALETRIQACGLVYLLTGERQFGDLAKNYALTLCDWSQWTDPDYSCPFACLDTSHFSHAAACAYDWCFDLFTPEERAKLREALLTKGAEAAYRASTESWAQKPDWPNGYAVVHGGLGIIGLCLLGEDDRAAKYVEQARQRAFEFLDDLDRDGGFIEGVLYGDYAISYLLPFAESLAVLGDASLVDHPYFERNLRFAIYCLSPSGDDLVNFCDSSVHDGRAYVRLAELLLKRWQSPVAEHYRRVSGADQSVLGWLTFLHFLWWPEQTPEPASLTDWSRSAHFRDIGWVVHRSDFSPEGFLFAVRSGPPGSHCHYDQNSFVLNYRGEWLAGDPGYGQGDTKVHNTLFVVRHDSAGGLSGDQNQTWSPGFVRSFYTSPLFSYSCHDAAECYPELSQFLRHVLVVGGEYLVVVDELAPAGDAIEAIWQVRRLGPGLPPVERTAGGFVIPGARPKGANASPHNLVVLTPLTSPDGLRIENADDASSVQIPLRIEVGAGLRASPVGAGLRASPVGAGLRASPLPLVLYPASVPAQWNVTADTAGNRLHLRIQRGTGTDDLLLRTGEGEMVAGHVRTDAYLCFVRQEEGKEVQAAMIDGTTVRLGERKLLALEQPGDAALW